VTSHDIPVLQGAVLLVGIVYMISTLVADIIIAFLNPRFDWRHHDERLRRVRPPCRDRSHRCRLTCHTRFRTVSPARLQRSS
jgi:hypothetical protein